MGGRRSARHAEDRGQGPHPWTDGYNGTSCQTCKGGQPSAHEVGSCEDRDGRGNRPLARAVAADGGHGACHDCRCAGGRKDPGEKTRAHEAFCGQMGYDAIRITVASAEGRPARPVSEIPGLFGYRSNGKSLDLMRRTVASHVGRGRVLVVDEAQDPDTAGSGHGRIWTRPGRNGFARRRKVPPSGWSFGRSAAGRAGWRHPATAKPDDAPGPYPGSQARGRGSTGTGCSRAKGPSP